MTSNVAGQVCPLCYSSGTVVCDDPRNLRICIRCNVLLSWQWASVADYENLYTHELDYHRDEMQARGDSPFYTRLEDHTKAAVCRWAFISGATNTRDTKSIIDIGAGTGAFVMTCAALGLNVSGVEPNAALAKMSSDGGSPVSSGSWKDVQGQYDIITMFDVFEHLTDPWACLEHLKGCLKPGGILVIEMPEFNAPCDRERGAMSSRHIKPREHIVLYSEPAATRMFDMNGFTTIAFQRPLRGTIGKACWVLKPHNEV